MGKVPTELSWKSVAEYLSWRPDQVSSCNLPHFTTLLEGICHSRQCKCVELQRNSVPTAQSLWSRQKQFVVQQHPPTTHPILYNSTLIASTLLLQSFIQALQRLVRARHVVVLMRCSVISKPPETRSSSMEAESSLTLSFALKTRVWETLSRNTIFLILDFLRKLGDA